MLPGLNPKQVAQAMKKMGMKQEDIDAVAVIIRTKTEDIIIRDPSVQKIDMMGQINYKVSGREEHRKLAAEEPQISEEDIKTVMHQANASRDEALSALKENDGDLAAAIISLAKE